MAAPNDSLTSTGSVRSPNTSGTQNGFVSSRLAPADTTPNTREVISEEIEEQDESQESSERNLAEQEEQFTLAEINEIQRQRHLTFPDWPINVEFEQAEREKAVDYEQRETERLQAEREEAERKEREEAEQRLAERLLAELAAERKQREAAERKEREEKRKREREQRAQRIAAASDDTPQGRVIKRHAEEYFNIDSVLSYTPGAPIEREWAWNLQQLFAEVNREAGVPEVTPTERVEESSEEF